MAPMRSPRLRVAFGLFLVSWALACETTVRPLAPRPEPPEALGEDQGLLFLHVKTEARIAELEISAVNAYRVAANLEPGEHFLFVPIEAGTYTWFRLHRYLGGEKARWKLDVPWADRDFRVVDSVVVLPQEATQHERVAPRLVPL